MAETFGAALVERIEPEIMFEQSLDGLRYKNRQGIGAGQKKAVLPKERRPLMTDKVKAKVAADLKGMAAELDTEVELRVQMEMPAEVEAEGLLGGAPEGVRTARAAA